MTLANVSLLALPTNSVQMGKPAKMDFVLMDVLTTKIALGNMSVFKEDVLIPAQLEKLVDPIANVRPETRPSPAVVLQVLLGFPRPSRVA